MKLSHAIHQYLEWKGTHTRHGADCYGARLRYFINWIGDRDITKITQQDVSKYILFLFGKYATGNVVYHIRILKNFFWYTSISGNKLQVHHTLIKTPRYVPNSYPHITLDQYKDMSSKMQEETFFDIRLKLLFRMLFDTGMRISELCDIKKSDINLEKQMATITTKKTLQRRWIFWSKETHRLLERYFEMRSCIQGEYFFIPSTKYNGKLKLQNRTAERWIKKIGERFNIYLVPHSLRHSKAIQILDCGGTVKDVQQTLGHSVPQSSFAYLNWTPIEISKRASLWLKAIDGEDLNEIEQEMLKVRLST